MNNMALQNFVDEVERKWQMRLNENEMKWRMRLEESEATWSERLKEVESRRARQFWMRCFYAFVGTVLGFACSLLTSSR